MSPDENDIMRSVEDHYWWYQALRRHVADSISMGTPDFSVLDAGCGTGGMLNVLRQRFPAAQLTGVDASQHALQLAGDRHTGTTLTLASVHELPFADASFDIVLSIDVLTAASVNDALAIHEAHRVLRPGGQLILNVAAFDFLRGAHDDAVEGKRRYTRPALRALLTGANFQIDRVTYWNATFTPPIALVRWLSRANSRRGQARSDFRPLPGVLNAMLGRVAALELNASRHVSLPFGTSLFAVAQKNG